MSICLFGETYICQSVLEDFSHVLFSCIQEIIIYENTKQSGISLLMYLLYYIISCLETEAILFGHH